MGCKKLTYHETLSPLKVVCNDLNVSGISCVDSYRYGFNGMEKDDNVKGESNSLDFGARIYDPRVGRWLSRDPLEAKYTFISPYVFVSDYHEMKSRGSGRKTVFLTLTRFLPDRLLK